MYLRQHIGLIFFLGNLEVALPGERCQHIEGKDVLAEETDTPDLQRYEMTVRKVCR